MRAYQLALALALCAVNSGHAMSLRVAPVLLDVPAPAKATQLTLRNGESQPVTVQLRVYRWSQKAGRETLEPTDAVVVSPPMITLPQGEEYLVRIVRISDQPILGEESYRLIVDELPDLARRRNGTVSFVLRQSIPIFFSGPDVRPAQVAWSIRRQKDVFILSARNAGGKRLRISRLSLKDPRGATVSKRDGLVGYVLGTSEMTWTVPASPGRALQARALQLVAESETEPINATPTVGSAH